MHVRINSYENKYTALQHKQHVCSHRKMHAYVIIIDLTKNQLLNVYII